MLSSTFPDEANYWRDLRGPRAQLEFSWWNDTPNLDAPAGSTRRELRVVWPQPHRTRVTPRARIHWSFSRGQTPFA